MTRSSGLVGFVAIFLFFGLAAATAHEQPKSVASSAPQLKGASADVAAVVDAFHAALKIGDTAKAAGLLDDAVLIYEAGGSESSKVEYAGHHLPVDAAYAKTIAETLMRRTVQVFGDMAWIASERETRAETGAAQANARLTTETMVLRRTAGAWRIVHVHWSSRPRPAPKP